MYVHVYACVYELVVHKNRTILSSNCEVSNKIILIMGYISKINTVSKSLLNCDFLLYREIVR
jgi:energy-converting hydrogenase Eha subunit C